MLDRRCFGCCGHRSSSCGHARSDDVLKCFDGERFGKERIGSEGNAAGAIFFGRLGGDDNRTHGAVPFRVSNESDEFQTIDVGHVDVGDDEIVVITGQKPQSIEAAGRFDNFNVVVGCAEQFGRALESRANVRPDSGRVFDDQNASHGCAA